MTEVCLADFWMVDHHQISVKLAKLFSQSKSPKWCGNSTLLGFFMAWCWRNPGCSLESKLHHFFFYNTLNWAGHRQVPAAFGVPCRQIPGLYYPPKDEVRGEMMIPKWLSCWNQGGLNHQQELGILLYDKYIYIYEYYIYNILYYMYILYDYIYIYIVICIYYMIIIYI